MKRARKPAPPPEAAVTQTTILIALLSLLVATALNVHHLALWCLPLALPGAPGSRAAPSHARPPRLYVSP
jgi:hypothetical protein